MTKLILFFNSFLSYLLVFVIITALVIIAAVLGVKWKKRSDAGRTGGVEEPVMPENVNVSENVSVSKE